MALGIARGLAGSCDRSARADEDRPAAAHRPQLLDAADDGDWSWAAHLADQTGRAGAGRLRPLARAAGEQGPPALRGLCRIPAQRRATGRASARCRPAPRTRSDRASPVEERLAFFASRAPRTRQGRILYAEALLAVDRQRRSRDAAAARAGSRTISATTTEAQFLDRYGGDLRASDDAARLDRLLWDERTDQARRMLARVNGARTGRRRRRG